MVGPTDTMPTTTHYSSLTSGGLINTCWLNMLLWIPSESPYYNDSLHPFLRCDAMPASIAADSAKHDLEQDHTRCLALTRDTF